MIFYVTIFGEQAIIFYVIILTIIFLTLKLITYNDGVNLLSKLESKRYRTNEYRNEVTKDATFVSIKTLEQKIITLSISLYRAGVFIITSVAIIAVDFKIFPRVHAKTNEFGLSLMDLGIFNLL